MSAVERAEQDVSQGDLGQARLRLASYLQTKGYDAAVLARLGRICADMHDPRAAGMYWLTSDAAGPEVNAAIEYFLRSGGRAPASAVGQLPLFMRNFSLSDYAGVAQERLHRYGLQELILRQRETIAIKVRNRALGALYVWVVVLLLITMAVGCFQIVRWLASVTSGP